MLRCGCRGTSRAVALDDLSHGARIRFSANGEGVLVKYPVRASRFRTGCRGVGALHFGSDPDTCRLDLRLFLLFAMSIHPLSVDTTNAPAYRRCKAPLFLSGDRGLGTDQNRQKPAGPMAATLRALAHMYPSPTYRHAHQ